MKPEDGKVEMIHHCRECGDPARVRYRYLDEDGEEVSAWYCEDCADGLGIVIGPND